MNHNSLPPINSDNHNKSTHELLHNILLNSSVLSDKYKSLTIINNTINYNNNINNYNNYSLKNNNSNKSNPSFSKNKKEKEYNDDIQILDENDSFDINKSISLHQKQEEIEKLKINLNNSKNYKEEIRNIQNEKSVTSRLREENNAYFNDNILNSENIIVDIEEISNSKINNENDKEIKYNIKNQKAKENDIEYKVNEAEHKNKSKKISDNIYEINFDSPNKNANLVKKGKQSNKIYNSLLKNKNEEDIIKLYNLNNTISNDIIFIFANEETEYGLKVINLGMKYFVQNINNKQISIYIFDMNNKSENNKMNEGIEILLTEIQLHKIIKIVLCCGDESVFDFVNKLNENSVNLEKIIFCALPFGGSNDLSTHFGFGKLNSYSKIIRYFI